MWLAIAGLSGFLAALIGAIGEHAFHLSAKATHIFQIANQYHFYHSLLLALCGYISLKAEQRKVKLMANIAALLCFVGLICFSGSLYLYTLDYLPNAVLDLAPIGGVSFMLAWLCIGIVGGMQAMATLKSSQ